MYRAMIEKDIPSLDRVLDDAFVLVHMTGMRQKKADFLQAVEDGTLNYASADHEGIEVSVQCGTATLSGRSLVRAAVFGGIWHTWRLRQDLTLVFRDDRWLISLSEASTY